MRTLPKNCARIRTGWCAVAASIVGGFLGACGGDGPKQKAPSPVDTTQAHELFGPSSRQPKTDQQAGSWTIALLTVPPESADMAAMQTLSNIRSKAGLPDAFLLKRAGAIMVVYGKYASPTDPTAQADLQRIKAIQIGADRPFEAAMLLPPEFSGPMGANPELNLLTARAKYGAKKKLYTLQIGAYTTNRDATEAEFKQIRDAAEKAAADLRADGDEAFYFHGPHRSMVTVGVFTDADIDPRPGRESPLLVILRRKHPYNLVNGQAIRVRTPGEREGKLQESALVAIPE